jgi:hypothetical protein
MIADLRSDTRPLLKLVEELLEVEASLALLFAAGVASAAAHPRPPRSGTSPRKASE